MTLQSTGPISIQDINVELNYSATRQTSLNEEHVRRLLGIYPTGQPKLSLAYGKTRPSGTITYSTPGTYSFVVPPYGTLTVQANGGGGGGGGAAGRNATVDSSNENATTYTYLAGFSGGSGTSSSFGSATPLIGGGGGGSGGAPAASSGNGTTGAAAVSSGGTTNSSTGGGTAGTRGVGSYADGGVTAPGGYALRAWAYNGAGAPTIGSTVTVVVGAGGAGQIGGLGNNYVGPSGTAGGNGSVVITWS